MSVNFRIKLITKLKNKEYRDAYVASHIRNGIAWQIRLLREQRSLTQAELARKVDLKNQASISRLEDPDYGKVTISTLQKLAAVFDVALVVKFVPFSKLIEETEDLSPEALTALSFPEEVKVLEKQAHATTDQTILETLPYAAPHLPKVSIKIMPPRRRARIPAPKPGQSGSREYQIFKGSTTKRLKVGA